MNTAKTLKKFVKCHTHGKNNLKKGSFYELKGNGEGCGGLLRIKGIYYIPSLDYFKETKTCNFGHEHIQEVKYYAKHKTMGFVEFIKEVVAGGEHYVNYKDPSISIGQNAGSIIDFLCEEESMPVEPKEEPGISTYVMNYIWQGIGYKITRKVPNTEPKISHNSNYFIKREIQTMMCGYREDLEKIMRKGTFVTDVTKVAIESFYVPKRPKSHTSIPDSYTYEEFANFYDTYTRTSK